MTRGPLASTLTPVAVEVYSSFAYAVEPRAFHHDNARHSVERVERMWKTPGRTHFYVRDAQQHLFELIYEQSNDRWWLRSFGESCSVPRRQHVFD